jgi:FKBP-type peptidyl-prolyl cis-trans isomerase SlyD
MQISADKVVLINYTLTNSKGEKLDSSEGREPLAYIHGYGNLIPGLERDLEGKKTGDSFKASIAPDDAYGVRTEENVHLVSKSGFQGDEEMFEGMQVQVETNDGPVMAHITSIKGDDVTLDLNHPLAGETLHFDVEVVEVRDASKDELAHGHVHGPGGHHH